MSGYILSFGGGAGGGPAVGVEDGELVEVAGGKGGSLLRLAAGGQPVPAGFVLTMRAYRDFVAEQALAARILAAAAADALPGNAGIEAAASNIRALFMQAPLGERIRAEVAAAWRHLCARIGAGDDLAVAVRSSANAEDLPELSFAGQQDSWLNVRGEAAVLAAVQRCWASLWNARAMAYRQQMGIAPDGVAMAVVVQVMVQADVSGIVFTANPHSGDREELVINASFGLGEAIVGGEITADSYRVERATLAIRETRLGSKALRIVAAPGQGTRHETLAPALQATSSLPEALQRTLCARALAVEAAFGGVPQDIEWAFVGQTLWLLQARPITHLPPPPLRDVRWQAPADDAGGLYLRNQLVEHIPEPASTLFEDVYLHDALQVAWGRTQRGLRPADTRPPACWITHRCINGYAYKRIGPAPWPADLPRPPPAPPAPPGSYDLMNFRYLKGSVRRAVTHWRDVGMPAYRAAIAAQAALDVEHATAAELLAAVRALAQADANAWFGGIYGAFNSARMVETMLDRFLSAHLPGKRTGVFLAGLDSKTMRAQHALFAIAERIRADTGLRARVLATPAARLEAMLAADASAVWVLAAVREVLAVAGTQLSSLDFAEPTAAENLVPTLTNLQALVADAARDPQATQQLLARRRAVADAEALAALPPKRRRELRWRLAIARRYYPYREEGLACAGQAWPLLRHFALVLGARLVAASSIAKADDVFFLTTAEIESAAAAPTSLSSLVRERRQLREQQKRLRPPFQVPETVPADSPWAGFVAGIAARRGARPPVDAQTLIGNAVATGRVTAMASVILEPADFARMQPGSILVCPTTTPAWTQLFSQARGLVTDTGSFLAHGAIVAREFGIPAVLGVADATARIRHGQMLAIDGDAGTVTLLDAEADTVGDAGAVDVGLP